MDFRISALYALNCPSFTTSAYSRFKYGSGAEALRYGEALAAKLWAQEEEWLCLAAESGGLLTSSAFKYVPTASYFLALAVLDALNARLSARHLPPFTFIKIVRLTVFEGDYGSLTTDARHALMQRNRLYIDHDLLQNRHLIVIDDVRITGAHQHKILAALAPVHPSQIGVAGLCFAYIAAADPTPQPVQALTEWTLNHAAIHSPQDVVQSICQPDFCLNARVCKYLLSLPQPELAAIIPQIPTSTLRTIIAAMIGDGYNIMPAYQTNFQLLYRAVKYNLQC